MKHKSTRDVTKASNPYLPPTYTTGKPGMMGERNRNVAPVKAGAKLPDITPPTMVSGFSKGITSRESNLNNSRSFSLPSSINPMDTYNERFASRRMNYNPPKPK